MFSINGIEPTVAPLNNCHKRFCCSNIILNYNIFAPGEKPLIGTVLILHLELGKSAVIVIVEKNKRDNKIRHLFSNSEICK